MSPGAVAAQLLQAAVDALVRLAHQANGKAGYYVERGLQLETTQRGAGLWPVAHEAVVGAALDADDTHLFTLSHGCLLVAVAAAEVRRLRPTDFDVWCDTHAVPALAAQRTANGGTAPTTEGGVG